MKQYTTLFVGLVGFLGFSVSVNAAGENCQASIVFSVDQDISPYTKINFNASGTRADGTPTNKGASVQAGRSRTVKVPCGQYTIAATPMAQSRSAAAAVGRCTYNNGKTVDLVNEGDSTTVSFDAKTSKENFQCPANTFN